MVFLCRAFIAGGIAACGAVTVTHSFETVKIRYGLAEPIVRLSSTDGWTCRLQLQGELQSKAEATKKYRGVFHGIKVILQNEGPGGLFRGLNCAVRTLCRQSGQGVF